MTSGNGVERIHARLRATHSSPCRCLLVRSIERRLAQLPPGWIDRLDGDKTGWKVRASGPDPARPGRTDHVHGRGHTLTEALVNMVDGMEARPAAIDGDSTVWAFSDTHGVASGLAEALRQAGLTDTEDHWIAPPRTALIGCGDYIDRGTDTRGVVELLSRLRVEAFQAGGHVVLLRGNHEQMAIEALTPGRYGDVDLWLSDIGAGAATLRSIGAVGVLYDQRPNRVPEVEDLMAAVNEAMPEFIPFLRSTAPWARWRDVLFSHAGTPPGRDLASIGDRQEQMWQDAEFHSPRAEAGTWDLDSIYWLNYRAAGIGRHVYGHQPFIAPRIYQEGRAMCIDTNASAHSLDLGPLGERRQGAVTLVRVAEHGSLSGSDVVSVDTTDAPDRQAP